MQNLQKAIHDRHMSGMLILWKRNVAQLLFTLICTLFFCYWQWKITGSIGLVLAAIYFSFAWSSLNFGNALVRCCGLPDVIVKSSAPRFVLGFLALNFLLVALALVLPLGAATVFVGLVIAGLLLRWSIDRYPDQDAAPIIPEDFTCLIVAGVAATLWSLPGLHPTDSIPAGTVYNLWGDMFFHTRLIEMFSTSHGASSLSNILMSGAPLGVYHYGIYLFPATLVAMSGISPLNAFAGFLEPFGILLSGLAAYVLASSMYGRWAGVAAMVALLLFPDAYQQGFANRYLSYNFLQQVNPGGLYGVTCAAAAWTFIFSGCRSGSYRHIFIGYALVLMTALYKSHVFIAVSYLALIYPCFFFHGSPIRLRLLSGFLFTTIFASAVWVSQRSSAIPTLRLDFSAAGRYSKVIVESFDYGITKDIFSSLVMPHHGKLLALIYSALMLLVASFGWWLFALMAASLIGRTKTLLGQLVFPSLILLNYLVMSLGLAANETGIGSFDELMNRPLVWAYFATVVCSTGLLFKSVFDDISTHKIFWRCLAGATVIASFGIPVAFAHGLQTYPLRGVNSDVVPNCLSGAGSYVRSHSAEGEVIQDSLGDSKLILGYLADRREYAVGSLDSNERSRAGERITQIRSWMADNDAQAIVSFAHSNKIKWFVLRPESRIAWPVQVDQHVAYSCGGYSVFEF